MFKVFILSHSIHHSLIESTEEGVELRGGRKYGGAQYLRSGVDMLRVDVFFGIEGNFFTADTDGHGRDGAALDDDAV